jgi:hypothetical protein
MSSPTLNQTVSGEGHIFTATGDIKIIYNLPPPEAEDHRDLLILQERVREIWLSGVLEGSVHHEAQLAIQKTRDPDAVDHPWETILELPNRTSETLPPGKKCSEIFEETGRSLLVLGAPGSGKTISMLEITRDLIDRVSKNPTQPLPVVFHLSTWSAGYRRLSDWLVDELKSKYSVPGKIGRQWLKKKRLLLFLDGLDEVKQDCRAACVIAINDFIQEFAVPGIVVCSRIEEYVALPVRLGFRAAIRLQPLSLDQIDEYLARAGDKLADLRAFLNHDKQLQALAQSPLC